MREVRIQIPEESLVALRATPESFAVELMLAAAMKLYELGRLSAGAAARLADVPEPVFLSKLADYGIDAFRQTASELAEEVANA
jgi:predicted HTH domain antitoxin